MNNQNNETQFVSQTKTEKEKSKEKMKAKILASVATGMVVGAGTTFASERLFNTSGEIVDELHGQEGENEQNGLQPTVEERLAELEEKERIREKQELERQKQELERQKQEVKRQQQQHYRMKKDEQSDQQREVQDEKNENNSRPPLDQNTRDFFSEHDVKIDSVEEQQLENGNVVRIYTGYVDGHDAAFMDDGKGNIIAAIIDQNDNGIADENEIVDLRTYGISCQQLEVRLTSNQASEVAVLGVEHGVNMNGQTVDVAAVSVNDERMLLVDTKRNGEVDLIIADENHNNEIEDNEVHDVSASHIAMPTADDVDNNMMVCTDDNMDDYSNNADVAAYEV